MQLVSVLFVTMALSVYQLVQATITQMAWIANSAMNCVLVDARGQGISLAKEDAMHVILSTFIGMTRSYPVLHNAQQTLTGTGWSKP